jgi:cellulase
MGRLADPKQDPTTVDFFKIHENTYDTKTHLFGSEVMYNNNMTWTVQIPSNLKPGDYVVRHELIALHYALKDQGPEFYISCLNLKVLGDGAAEPKKEDTGRFPGSYKADDPSLKFNLHHHENKYVSRYLYFIVPKKHKFLGITVSP